MGVSQTAGSSSGFNNAVLERVLKRANLLSAADIQDPDKISNEALWNIFNLYKVEKSLQKEHEEISKRKNAYNSYHKELKDQLQDN